MGSSYMHHYNLKINNICIYIMNPCVFIIFSLLYLRLEPSFANQLVINKCSDNERHALLHFKSHLQDSHDSDHLPTWRADKHDCCTWEGVTCNNQTGHVTKLNLSGYNLEGEISQSLLNLSYLNNLYLSGNSFNGTIPTFIGSMTQLWYLDLSDNDFEGIIPRSVSSLTKLRALRLDLNNLNGTIPRFIGSLTELRMLDLSYNSLYGTIPPEFGNLTNLEILVLSYAGRCRVENLDWSSHLSHMEILYMDGISLASQNHWVNVVLSIPKLFTLSLKGCELSQVMYPYSSFLNSSSSLISLVLGNNNLTSSMYHWMFPLTSNKLQYLYLSDNMLDGIPKYLGNLSSLENLIFDNNSAMMEFPVFLNNLSDEIRTLKNLFYLDISNNGILDTVHQDFWDMWPSQLRYLNLSSNSISGKAPDLSSAFDNNSVIDLSSNNFYGPISNVSSTVASLNLSRNKFYGGISFLCQIVHGNLSFVDLSHNFLSGQLPDCLWHFKELKVLNLGHNNLSGRLPPSIGSLIQLEALYLYENNFSGELPFSIKNCTSLTSLILWANKFSGNVPVWIGENLSGLYVLILRSNNFFGTIPLQLCRLANLQILDLSINNLHGSIPSCLNNLTSMVQERFLPTQNVHSYIFMWFYSDGICISFKDKYVDNAIIGWQGNEREFSSNLRLLKMIDLSSNNLTGQIPYEITNLYELVSLNLSNNALLGEIPWNIGQMKKLLTLDLSRNNFSGGIPSSMSGMTFLNHLDVSYNSLSGRIPSSTQLQSFPPSRYDGNAGLCGPPLTKKCTGDEESEPTSVNDKSEGDGEDIDEVWGWFYIGGGTGFVTGFWIACGTLLLNRRGRHVFFHFYDSFKDWVYVKIMVFIVNLQRVRHT